MYHFFYLYFSLCHLCLLFFTHFKSVCQSHTEKKLFSPLHLQNIINNQEKNYNPIHTYMLLRKMILYPFLSFLVHSLKVIQRKTQLNRVVGRKALLLLSSPLKWNGKACKAERREKEIFLFSSQAFSIARAVAVWAFCMEAFSPFTRVTSQAELWRMVLVSFAVRFYTTFF